VREELEQIYHLDPAWATKHIILDELMPNNQTNRIAIFTRI
jgi:hypothetical protein